MQENTDINTDITEEIEKVNGNDKPSGDGFPSAANQTQELIQLTINDF